MRAQAQRKPLLGLLTWEFRTPPALFPFQDAPITRLVIERSHSFGVLFRGHPAVAPAKIKAGYRGQRRLQCRKDEDRKVSLGYSLRRWTEIIHEIGTAADAVSKRPDLLRPEFLGNQAAAVCVLQRRPGGRQKGPRCALDACECGVRDEFYSFRSQQPEGIPGISTADASGPTPREEKSGE